MIILIIILILILVVIIWGGVTNWEFIIKKSEYFDNKKFPDYVVCSTSNSPYQNWQCELLAYSFNKVKQGGKLIILCSDDPYAKGRTLPKFKNAETLKYPDWMKEVKFPNSDYFYGPRNGPFSMQKWVNSYPNLKDDETVLFVEPDMVFINPIKIDVSKGVVWGHKWIINGNNKKFDLMKRNRIITINNGDNNKFNLITSNRKLITDDYSVMFPLAMTIGDVKKICNTYTNLTDKAFKMYPEQDTDMYVFIMSIADSNLKTKPVNLANYHNNMNDNDPKYIIHYWYDMLDNKNNKIFFKHDYTQSTETIPWKRPCDINKASNKRDKELLSLIHEYIDQQ